MIRKNIAIPLAIFVAMAAVLLAVHGQRLVLNPTTQRLARSLYQRRCFGTAQSGKSEP